MLLASMVKIYFSYFTFIELVLNFFIILSCMPNDTVSHHPLNFMMQPKYIQNLIKKAKEREQYRDIVYERKIAKERSKDDHLYADKDKFITEAYRKKLAERERQMELERLHELQEERDDVCSSFFKFSRIHYHAVMSLLVVNLIGNGFQTS